MFSLCEVEALFDRYNTLSVTNRTLLDHTDGNPTVSLLRQEKKGKGTFIILPA